MNDTASRLKEARAEAGYETATDAARAFGWNENTYRSNENGQRGPGRKSAIKYARAFRVSVDWLLTGRGSKRVATGAAQAESVRQISILRWTDISMADATTLRAHLLGAEARGFVVAPDTEALSTEAFALEIQDDSMVDPKGSALSLYPGDRVIIDPDRAAKPGNVVLAKDGRKSVIRKLRLLTEEENGKSSRVALVPLNPDFATAEADGDKVLGVMAGFYRRSS